MSKIQPMCGRFAITKGQDELRRAFDLDELLPLRPTYNVAPSQIIAAVRVEPAFGERPAHRALVPLQWGLLPPWAKDRAIAQRLINARAETVHEKPAFRSAFKRRRCLVPADGYYEWKAAGKRRRPYYFSMRDGACFGIAALWERWESGDGSVLETCALLTCEPNAVAAEVHDRMPVIIPRAQHDAWLDPATEATDGIRAMLRPYPAESMQAWPVSPLVNNPRLDSPELIAPEGAEPGSQMELF